MPLNPLENSSTKQALKKMPSKCQYFHICLLAESSTDTILGQVYIPVDPQFHGRKAEVVSLEPRPGWPTWQLFKTCANNQEGGRE